MGCRYIAASGEEDLNRALPHLNGDMIAVFRAGSVPRHEFLARLLGYFETIDVALVQVPQTFYNVDSFQHQVRGLHRQIWNEQSLYFDVVEPGLDYHGAALAAGEGYIVRRSALDEVGGFGRGTAADHLHTTFRLHSAGFQSVYHSESLAFCSAPPSVVPYVKERARNSRGRLQLLRREWKRLLGSRWLTLRQRLLYLAPASFLACLQRTIYYSAPFLYVAFALSPFAGRDWLVVPFLLSLALAVTVQRILARGRARPFLTEIFRLYTYWYNGKYVASSFLPWNVRATDPTLRGIVMPALVLFGASGWTVVAALTLAFRSGSFGLCAAGVFAFLNVLVSAAALLMARKKPYAEDTYSFFDYRPVRVRRIDGQEAEEHDLGVATVISAKSLSMIHMTPFPPEAMVEIELDLPSASLPLRAKVTRSHAQIAKGQAPIFQSELEFVQLTQSSRIRLVRYFFEDATPKLFASAPVEKVEKINKTGNEQRGRQRLPTIIPIFYRSETEPRSTLGLLADISWTGARIKISGSLEVGSTIVIDLPWFTGSVKAEVVRCTREQGQAHPPCDVGVRFLAKVEFTPQQLKSIQALKSSAEFSSAA
jgi:cellulose synthase (UDP-forming)